MSNSSDETIEKRERMLGLILPGRWTISIKKTLESCNPAVRIQDYFTNRRVL